MKVVNIMGGLGNQMFQYAFSRVINADALDISWFEESKNNPAVTPRNYELDLFKCNPNILTPKQSKQLKNNKLLKIFGIKTGLKIIEEKPENIYNPQMLEYKSGLFVGYFQCAQYYDNIRKDLLADFILKNEPNEKNSEILNLISSTNSVSLHVRRGDYVKLQDFFGLCDLDYYKSAINFIADKVENPHFFLFSDDVDWVKENLKIDFPYTIVDFNHGKDSVWDMMLMKNCKHNIIANSSFSWWGAWLNENPDKIVIAPKQWFADGTKTDIVPDNWQRI